MQVALFFQKKNIKRNLMNQSSPYFLSSRPFSGKDLMTSHLIKNSMNGKSAFGCSNSHSKMHLTCYFYLLVFNIQLAQKKMLHQNGFRNGKKFRYPTFITSCLMNINKNARRDKVSFCVGRGPSTEEKRQIYEMRINGG